ncbi:MAG: alpha/beta hydrolase [Gammaproteobacteria bacterium]
MAVIIILLIIVGLIHIWAKASARKIQATPSAHSFETLNKEPTGDETFIIREDGTRIRAISIGEGPTVILAHGYGSTLQEWNVVWDLAQKEEYRVIAFDLRGHGKSTIGSDGIGSQQMAGDYKAVLEYFDVHDGLLVGHSLGGFLVIVLLLTHSQTSVERLKGVVLFASMAGNVLKGSPQTRILSPLIKWGIPQKLMASNTYGWILGASFFGNTPIPAAIKVLKQIFPAQHHNKLIPITEALAKEDYYSRLQEIQLPCVVICGEKDNTTPAWHSEALGKGIPNARNVWVEGKGHMLNWEAPETLIEAIQSFGE